jgi:hypothetical protein
MAGNTLTVLDRFEISAQLYLHQRLIDTSWDSNSRSAMPICTGLKASSTDLRVTTEGQRV